MVRQFSQNVRASLTEHVTLVSILKGITVSYLITLPAFMIFAFVLTYTDFPEMYIPTCVMIVTVMSILIAGSTATRHVKNRGWINGAFVGLIYMLILYIFSSITFNDFSIDKDVTMKVAIGVLTGSIGGIIGINLKRHSRGRNR